MYASDITMSRLSVALSVFAALVLLVGAAGFTSAATPGFAVYKVAVTTDGQSQSFTANETVTATSSPLYDNVTLSFASAGQTFSYSRTVNASDDLSPFIPSISNQTFSSTTVSSTVKVNVLKNGTIPLQFQGASYTLTSYSLAGSLSSNGTTVTIQGALTTFQSGLVHSASLTMDYPAISASALQGIQADTNSSLFPFATGLASLPSSTGTFNISITLLSTSLPLNASSPSATARVVSVGIGAGAVVSALAIGLGVRRHNKHETPTSEDKPEHWVD